MTPKLTLKTKFALAVAVFLWGSAFVGIRAGLQGYTPGALGALRFWIGAVCMLFIYLRLKNRSKIPAKHIIHLLIIGIVTIGAYHLGLNYGEVTVSSGVASFIISQSPIMTALFAFIFLGERLNKWGVLGMFISFVGVSLILLAQNQSIALELGVVYVIIASIAGSIYSVWQKPFLKLYNATEVTTFVMWGGAIIFSIFLPEMWRDLSTAPISATLSVVYLGIFPAAIAYIAWSYALTHMSASHAVNYLYFMPLIATLLGWLILGEVPPVLSIIGGLIALVGVWVVNHSHRIKYTPRI